MTPELRSRIFRELLQLQLCRVGIVDALEAVAEELDLDVLRQAHRAVKHEGATLGAALAAVAPEGRETLARADETGDFQSACRDLAELPEGAEPPAGTLAGDLFAVYGELARVLEDRPVVEAARVASELPVREELRAALRQIAAENSFIRAMRERPALFSPTARLMVKHSEECGGIQKAFLLLADGLKAGAYLSRGDEP
ncbi:MAG TPA: hypothetical protein VF950_13240 [Planctomycetota bacterium]